ncbi:protein ZAR1-like [Diretmus argenteus]
MEGFVSTFSPYTVSGNAGCGPFLQGGSWGKREGRFMIPQGLNYLELCKAILSQVTPNSPPRLRKANTKDCGVQVNATLDKIVQCSLGPKTLFSQEGDVHVPSDSSAPAGKALCSTPVNELRFLRPVSIYSPVFDRRRTFLKSVTLTDDDDDGECEGQAEAAEIVDPHPDKDAETDRDEDTVSPMHFDAPLHRASKGSNFQFLEQRYGFFHCRECNIRWESAYVWCISGTSKVYYKQLCRKCQVGFNPYRVESILCKGCSQTCCCCEKKQRHINMRRPHRQNLCCRCKGMRLSCDATYSFKYII